VIKQVFLHRIPVEPGDGAQPPGNGGPGAAAGLQVAGETLNVGPPCLEQAQVVLVALRRPRDYADLAAEGLVVAVNGLGRSA